MPLPPTAQLLAAMSLAASPPALPPVVDIDAPVQGVIPAPLDAAVVIGNQDYRTLPDAPHAARDAHAFQGFLQYTRGISADRIELVVDGTKATMLQALQEGAREVQPGGTLWIYFVGHGAVDVQLNDRLLVGVEAVDAPKSVARQAISLGDIMTACQASGHRTLLVLDTSFRGVGRDGTEIFSRWRYAASPVESFLPEDLMIWSAVSPDQDARLLTEAQHGLFTYHVIGALRGWADGAEGRPLDGSVNLEEAHVWLRNAVAARTDAAVSPLLERGGSATQWDLSHGAMERPPGTTVETPPSGQTVSALTVEPGGEPTNGQQKAAEAIEEIQTRASRAWAGVAQEVAKGQPAGALQALEAFVLEFGNQTVMVDGKPVAVYVEEVEMANELMARLKVRGSP